MPETLNLKKYAQVAIEIGLGLDSGDRLMIMSPIAAAQFTRLLVEAAYEKGAANVDVIWSDDEVTRSRFSHGGESASEAITGTSYLMNNAVETGDYLLSVRADDPNLLSGQDPDKVANHQRANGVFMKPVREAMATLTKNWSIVAAPTAVWATAVFPQMNESEAVEAMWDAVFRVCRVDQPDPVDAWRQHLDGLARRCLRLNQMPLDALRYTGPGTDLVVGLPGSHVWVGGSATSPSGVKFVPNIPTEEVFTAPDMTRAEGKVTATKPLSLYGSLVEGFSFEMSEGRVTGMTAERGGDLLEKIIGREDSTGRFGEVALVPQTSNVAREGLVWQNTLYDENDACHIALGTAYPICLEGGIAMSPAQRAEAGLNESSIHVDFVVGSPDLSVFGVDADGKETALLEGGEWAFSI